MAYQCEWEREECATRGMTTAEMVKHYKDESVRGWCRFYLADPGDMSEGLRDAIRELLEACGVKEKPAHKAQREALRRSWQAEAYARSSAGAEKPVCVNQHVNVRMSYDRPPAQKPAPVYKMKLAPHHVVIGPRIAASLVRRYARAA